MPSRNSVQLHKASSLFQLNKSNKDQAWKLLHQALIQLLSQWWRLKLIANLLWDNKWWVNLNIKRWTLNINHLLMSNHSQLTLQCNNRLSIQRRARALPSSNFHSERALMSHQLLKALDNHQCLLVKPEPVVTCQILESLVPSTSKPFENSRHPSRLHFSEDESKWRLIYNDLLHAQSNWLMSNLVMINLFD